MALRISVSNLYCFITMSAIFIVLLSADAMAVNLSVESVLGTSSESSDSESTESFKRVTKIRPFHFPQDHLAHPDYKTEWWYFSGHLQLNEDAVNNVKPSKKPQFGYQFTLFRFALASESDSDKPLLSLTNKNPDWRTRHIYMAHVALTDLTSGHYYNKERFSRDSIGLAGAQQQPDGTIRFWLNNWSVQSLESGQLWPLKLQTKVPEFSLNLQMDTQKPVVLQGEQGLSQKSKAPGNASYYYSYTRVKTLGTIRIGTENYSVIGNSWLDREWSTSSLGADQQGWDWFALHLEDGSELMLYQMRKKDGRKDEFSSGVLVDTQGYSEKLGADSFKLKVVKFWKSPVSGIQYPTQWQLEIPEHNLNLTIKSLVKQQEWSKAKGQSFNYWEGSVEASGVKNQQTIKGVGYLEMTGYQSKH